MRFVDNQVFEILARLNVELAERGDPARVRYARVTGDLYLEDLWVVIAVWELDRPPGQDAWPREQLDVYDQLTWERLRDIDEVTIYNRFLTREEIAADPHLGRPVPELV
jgi:hypothetical protein